MVLAGAGFSKRFGKDKRVTELGGNTLAGTTINLYQMAFERLRIVIRPEDELEKLDDLDSEIQDIKDKFQ